MTIPLELLAPAGNVEIGIAAIDHGADAVYVGAPNFSARAEAGVTVDDIARLVNHAHLYYARVYVALNTILTDRELPRALDIIRDVYRLGADGLIIQDVGLLELDLPPIPLIASTQMHNSTPEKIQFLEAVGFKRAILARELSLDEITTIRQKTGIELEAFVHGALCVSYSGQCYMSQAATGRSGNRGVCAQPCRFPYTLIDGNGNIVRKQKYLLSLKDLNLMNILPDLIASGVTSFKIEGRYKGIDYVKNITAAYRQAIDRFIGMHPDYCRSSSGISEFTFSPDPVKTFNRGYTQYFISGKREKVASIDTQKSIGQPIGTITGMGKDFFRLDAHDLHNGDGLCFFTKENNLTGFRVNRIESEKIYPNSMKGLRTGTLLYRNHDTVLSRTLKKSSARRTIAVEMDFIQEDNHIRLILRDEDGNEAVVTAAVLFEPARDPSLARLRIETHLLSSGNTPYRVSKLTVIPQLPGFIPVSTLNGIRRDALEMLTRIRFKKYPGKIVPFNRNTTQYPEKRLDYHANVLNNKARQFYKRHGVEITEPAFELLENIIGKTVMTTRYCVLSQLGLCLKDQKTKHIFKTPFRMTDRLHTYRLDFDCQQCRMLVILEKK